MRKPVRQIAMFRQASWLLSAGFLAVSCQGSAQRSGPLPPPAPVVPLTMREYGFNLGSTIPTGRVVFEVTNTGRLEHEVVLLALPEGAPSVAEQLRTGKGLTLRTQAVLPRLAPGAGTTFAADLVPSRYALLCFVKDGDGQDHVRKGMTAEFRVR